MRPAHPREREVGIGYYASNGDGTGGRLRDAAEDFRVREIEAVETEPLDADPEVYRHLLFRARLFDWDTHDFARTLSNRLGISRERVTWAGTKDARAVTTQLFSIDGVDPGELPEIDGAELEAIGRFGRRIRLGDLAGNEFEITVEDPDAPENAAAITEELRAFASDAGAVAVPNYFGQQRFGSRRPVTHEVGLAIVRGDWKDAVLAYVGNPSEHEPAASREARRFVDETEDWHGALDRFPDRLGYERSMLHALVEADGDHEAAYRAALDAVPENLQRLFVHAGQSLLFNRIVSRRLESELPMDRAVPGDVICFGTERGGLLVPDPDRTQRTTEQNCESINRHVERGRAFVTAPLVGTETTLGEDEPGELERSVLADADLAPADFDLPDPYDSTGTRRAILVSTDLSVSRDTLAFTFALPKGSYATVLLREYLKTGPEAL